MLKFTNIVNYYYYCWLLSAAVDVAVSDTDATAATDTVKVNINRCF